MASETLIQITLVYSPQPRIVREVVMDVVGGTTVYQAILQSKVSKEYPDLVVEAAPVGIWGRLVDLAQTLRDQDRIEIYRALTVDPKVARRERFTKQGAKAAGLFAKKRDGAKAGY
jgi:putative ubiquitin-RnfH superfamily antitoxin RatB of RatAB toxin-antitoxin module